ncbi:DNA-3-methyladenine glycosylase I [Thiotrichales bacterium 19S3-7]|nr:DNA-3-methyladenine glycosylase I [Thiotrichales bacterium 19S3-7]MCF6802287.1 DNA-3-methyladenine glycosylase I [Thiotrichales bacterium 19S3-11]
MPSKMRCAWVNDDPLYISYHDQEWGVPLYDDQKLFEFLCLEGMQAGLSWITILKKRHAYRELFDNFDIYAIAAYDDLKVQSLVNNPKIIRNRLKINAIINNARACIKLNQKHTLSDYIWAFVDGKVLVNHYFDNKQVPSESEISTLMSNDLKKQGFKFVGPTICYAFMQAVGMVNDHTLDCFRHRELVKN